MIVNGVAVFVEISRMSRWLEMTATGATWDRLYSCDFALEPLNWKTSQGKIWNSVNFKPMKWIWRHCQCITISWHVERTRGRQEVGTQVEPTEACREAQTDDNGQQNAELTQQNNTQSLQTEELTQREETPQRIDQSNTLILLS